MATEGARGWFVAPVTTLTRAWARLDSPRLDRAGRRILFAAGVGLALRVAWVLCTHREPVGIYDPGRYLAAGESIARGDGYSSPFTGAPTAYYPPGYPAFLGVLIRLLRLVGAGGHEIVGIGLVQAVLGAATVCGVGVLARRLWSPAAGVAAAWLYALYPNVIAHTGVVLTETLYNALFVAALVVLVTAPDQRHPGTRRLVVHGVAFAAATMVRPVAPLYVVVLGVWWWRQVGRGEAVRRLALTLGVMAAVVVPWAVRNSVQMGSFVPMSTNTGDNLCIGHMPEATGRFRATEECVTPRDALTDGAAGEVAHDRDATSMALGAVADDPWRAIRLAPARFTGLILHDHDASAAIVSYGADMWMGRAWRWALFTSDFAWGMLLVLGLAGVVRAGWWRRGDRLILMGSAASVLVTPLLFFGDPRFKVPLIPLLAVVAGSALVGRPSDGSDIPLLAHRAGAPRSPHVPALEGVRALAACLIVVHHAAATSGARRSGVLAIPASVADIGVAVFFVLSGFLIYRPFTTAQQAGAGPPHFGEFLRSRVLRIYPAFWAALAFFSLAGTSRISEPEWMVRAVTLTHVGSVQTALVGLVQSWSLSVEMGFYLLVPVFAAVVSRAARRGVWWLRAELVGLGVLFAGGYLFRWWASTTSAVVGASPVKNLAFVWLPASLDLFALGMLLAVLEAHWARYGPPGWLARVVRPAGWWWAVAAGVFLAYAYGVGAPDLDEGYTRLGWELRQATYGLVGLLLLVPLVWTPLVAPLHGASGGGGRRSPLRWFLSWRPVVALGLVSYGLYLWHLDWLEKLADELAAPTPGLPVHRLGRGFGDVNIVATLGVGFAFGLAGAVVSWFCVEDPMQRWRKRVAGARPELPVSGAEAEAR